MKKIWNWTVARLCEPSTWAGLAAVGTCATVFATTVAANLGSGTKTGLTAAIVAGVIAVIKAEKGN